MQKKRNKQLRVYDLDSTKKAVRSLIGNVSVDYDLFEETDLVKIESKIKELNNHSNTAWLMSAIALYTLIYNQNMYEQSGLDWSTYIKNARSRLGMEARDISEQLSSARFFIQYHEKLIDAGWRPSSSMRILARAELALELSGDIDEVIAHISKDSWVQFKNWYSQFKIVKIKANPETPKVTYKEGQVQINGVTALSVSNELSSEEQKQMAGYLRKIAEAFNDGCIPAIIPVYNNEEAQTLIHLRDSNRIQEDINMQNANNAKGHPILIQK